MNRKILYYLRKKKLKKQIDILNNHINYTFIKNQKFVFIWCNYHTSFNSFVSIIKDVKNLKT